MASSRGQRMVLMAINQISQGSEISKNSENVSHNITVENFSTSATCSEQIIVVNEPENYPNIVSSSLDVNSNNYSFNYSELVSLAKESENEQTLSDEVLFDLDNIPIVLVENENVSLTKALLHEQDFENLLDEPSTSTLNQMQTEHQETVKNNQIMLVDYSSSSESEHYEAESVQKSKKFKRFDSDYSFHEEKDSDFFFSGSDSEDTDELPTNTVGESGLRKSRKICKKQVRRVEKTFGATKSVQENPCKNKACQNACAKTFTEQRHDIFEFYWGLGSRQRQRDWLLSCIKETEIKRRRSKNVENSRRGRTFKCIIPWGGEQVFVCQQFLLKTLCISQMTLRYTKNNADSESFAKADLRGKHEPFHKTKIADKNRVHEFIKKLPAVPSHYCRASSTKKYLHSELWNVSFLYRIFVKDQLEFHKIKTKISLKVFRKIFHGDFNLGFHLSKKDKCTICESKKDKDMKFSEKEESLYEKHIKDKDQCKTLFFSDQKISKEDSTFVCASFDLQKVLNTPHGDNMLLYCSRKYSFYNETVYESGTRNAFCYLWGETEGNRGCNEICTIINRYLEEVDQRGTVRTVALYCDSCAGQNRNRAMLTMLYTFLKVSKNIQHIKIVFLLPGHTYMPVDAVHAAIERFINKRIVWAPSEWPTLIANARVNPRPFKVIKMGHSDFICWKTTSQNVFPNIINKTKDGKNFLISQLRIACFTKGQDDIKLKYSYSDLAEEFVLPIFGTRKGKKSKTTPKQIDILYPSPLKISTIKYSNLMELCEKRVIPQRFLEEYKTFGSSTKIPDTLAETDEDDEEVTES